MSLRRTSYVAHKRSKTQNGRFQSEIALLLKKVCATKFLCVKTVSNKVVRHSLAYLVVQKWLVENVPFFAKIWLKLTHPLPILPFSIDFRW